MRSEWEFWCDTHGFRFDREYKYKVKGTGRLDVGTRVFESFAFAVRLTPSDRDPRPGADQAVSIFIDLPFPPDDDVERVAQHLAEAIAEKVSFQFGDLRLFYAAYFWERKPETPEEEKQVADEGGWGAKVHLIEDLGTEPFDSKALVQQSNGRPDRRLVAQFNATRRESSPLARFLGYFRILESIVMLPGKKRGLKGAMKRHALLSKTFAEHFGVEPFAKFVDDIVDKRHQCAHLKLHDNFGYVAADPRVQEEITPFIGPLELLARTMIERSGAPANTNGNN